MFIDETVINSLWIFRLVTFENDGSTKMSYFVWVLNWQNLFRDTQKKLINQFTFHRETLNTNEVLKNVSKLTRLVNLVIKYKNTVGHCLWCLTVAILLETRTWFYAKQVTYTHTNVQHGSLYNNIIIALMILLLLFVSFVFRFFFKRRLRSKR